MTGFGKNCSLQEGYPDLDQSHCAVIMLTSLSTSQRPWGSSLRITDRYKKMPNGSMFV